MLEKVNSPKDLKTLSLKELAVLASDIRKELIEIVEKKGGHLGSNLGVVELTIALHKVFDIPKDIVSFDVGHQGYVHKILTGRREILHKLREYKICSGFLQRDESSSDYFGAGHAGTALSAALGAAVARDKKKEDKNVIAFIGDASLGCGISMEALNNISESSKKLIIILNDNKMSISANVGALSKYLTQIVSNSFYRRCKHFIGDILDKIPKIGNLMRRFLKGVENLFTSFFSSKNIFEELGINYLGPIDGHNTKGVIKMMERAKKFKKPVLLHFLTQKGKGYKDSSSCPEKSHGVKKKLVSEAKKTLGFSESFGNAMCKLAKNDKKIIAITAGMCSGTGLLKFKEQFPDRLYDVGIAEEHAVIFAGGLAIEGFIPIVAIYATFIQRAMDCVFHDICLQNLPVIFCLDRGGLVEDGPTHHGIQDISFWLNLPNICVLQPKDDWEVKEMLSFATRLKMAVVIRYPKESSENFIENKRKIEFGKSQVVKDGKDLSLWTIGRDVQRALSIALELEEEGISIKVVNARFVKPFDKDALLLDAKAMPILTLEDHIVESGFGSMLANFLIDKDFVSFAKIGLPDKVISFGSVSDIRKDLKISNEDIKNRIKEILNKGL